LQHVEEDTLWLEDDESVTAHPFESKHEVHQWFTSNKWWKMAAVTTAIIACILVGMTVEWFTSGQAFEPQTANQAVPVVSITNDIMVDIHGDVKHPGVYKLPGNARLEDAVRAAGGFLHQADSSLVNAAEPLTDGQEIIINNVISGDTGHNTVPQALAAPNTSNTSSNSADAQGSLEPAQKIDLNTADAATLETIPGIGPRRAAEILSYRNTHGPFRSVED